MKVAFGEKLIKDRPELINKRVWFCPNKHQRLPCVVNDDGSISVIGYVERKFETAKPLITAISDGSIAVENFNLPPKPTLSRCSFSTRLYWRPDATLEITRFIENPSLPLPDQQPVIHSAADYSCPGFTIDDRWLSKISFSFVIIENGRMYSRKCKGRKCAAANICIYCVKARFTVRRKIKRIKERRLVCPGVTSCLSSTVHRLEWDGSRARFSSLLTSPTSARAKDCKITKEANRANCTPCQKRIRCLNTLRRRDPKSSRPHARRLLFSHYQITPEKREKEKLLVRKRRALSQFVKRQDKRANKTNAELAQYRPEDHQIRIAVRSMKEAFEKEKKRLATPRCEWMELNACCTGLSEDSTLEQLADHVFDAHLRPMNEENLNVEPIQRRYSCSWKNCGRHAKFFNYKLLVRHVINVHVGTREQLTAFEARISSAINASKKPNMRRYSPSVKALCARNYHSRAAYQRAARLSPIPIPSLRTVLRYRIESVGAVKSGVDFDVIRRFGQLARYKPHLRYGVLTFDEIHVRPGAKFNSSTLQMFGFAHDRNGTLATTMLVFQFISMFTSKRFAINVAFYGCSGLSSDVLAKWFWEVVFALDFCGIYVLATVCDGAAVNRSFQRKLLENEEAGVFSCLNLARPGRRIFVLSDPSHLIKKYRNSWMLRKLEKNLRPISWSHVLKVRNWQQTQKRLGRRLDRELTAKHVLMSSFGKMNVQLAVDVFSHATENIMLRTDQVGTAGTREFITACRTIWRVMNSHCPIQSYDEGLKLNEELIRVAEFFDQWKKDTDVRFKAEVAWRRETGETFQISEVKKEVYQGFVTTESHYDGILICKGVPQLLQYLFNELEAEVPPVFFPNSVTQDMLERDFCILRMRAGGGANPTVYDAAFCLKSVNMSRLEELK